MLKIILKELKQMFVTPAYYIILAVFIWILNFLFLKSFFIDSQMIFRWYFDLQIWFLMIFIPAISMKIISEEFRNNTMEFLLTKPISILKIILWKYLSIVIYFSIFILSSLVLYFSLSYLWKFPSWIIFSQIFGSILLIFAMFAVSFLASSITKNQVFAFLLWVLINFILIIIWTDFIQLSLPYFISNFLNWLSYFSHSLNFSKWIVSIWDILYFLSIIFFSLYLSYISVDNFKKTWKIGLAILSSIELFIVLLVLIFSNAIISKTNIFIDFTPNKIYTLSNSTKDILKNINDIVNIDLYISKELPPEIKNSYIRVKDLIGEFNKYSWNNIHLKEIYPIEDKKEMEAMKDGIAPIQIQILKDDQFVTQKGYMGLAIKYIDKIESIDYLWNTENIEYSLISKILKLTSNKKNNLAIMYSEDINSQSIQTISTILWETYDINTQLIDENTKELNNKDSDLFFIIEWDKKFWSGIINEITESIKNKNVLYFFQPVKVDAEEWLVANKNEWELSKILLSNFDLKLKEWLVWDLKYNSSINISQWYMSFRTPYPLFPKVFINKDLPISEWVSNIDLPFVSSLENTWSWNIQNLISTSKFGFENNDLSKMLPDDLNNITEKDLKEIILSKLVIKDNTKIAFIPNTYLFTLLWQQTLINNFKFVSNLADYLWWDSRLINIRWKSINYEKFIADNDKKDFIKWLNIFVLPLIILIIWIVVAIIRNRKRS